jgi:hypothetical protein
MPKQYIPPFDDEELDLTVTNDASEAIEVGRWDLIRFQPAKASGTWGAGEVVVEFSINGATFGNLPELGEIKFTSADDGVLSKAYYIPAVKRMRFRVKTTQGGACSVNVYCVVDVTKLEEIVQASAGSFS